MMLAELGAGCLLAALALAIFAAALGFWAGWRADVAAGRLARRALYAAAIAVGLASAALETGFLVHDFQIGYVFMHSDRSTPLGLLASGFYGGQEGSLLYWALVLGILASAALAASPGLPRLRAYAVGVLGSILAFILVVLVFAASPFETLPLRPTDGLGLNPVLRDGGMLIHPPFLLAGYSSFAVPFAFVMAALLAGRQDPAWLAATRRLALVSWGLQGTGLALGMWWAYHVLGWGGYWGWDPVENLALMPWLATTAYLHAAQIQERRGQLKAWNHGLLILAFLLTIFGTFVVRSGVIESVHSFAVSPLGPWFFAFLVLAVAFSGSLIATRSASLKPERSLESLISREGAFLLNNLLLLGLVSAIFWGTILPLVSGLITGRRLVAGPTYYERVAGPLLLLLLLLLAVGPLLPWRRAGWRWLGALRWPALAAGAAGGLALLAGVRTPLAVVLWAALAAAATTSLREFGQGLAFARRLPGALPAAAAGLARRHRRRYGAYLAHLGIVLLAAGVAGSQLWQQDRQLVLRPGESAGLGAYRLEYTGSSRRDLGDRIQTVATLRLGQETLEPGRTVYPDLGQSLSQVAIRSTPLEDLYVVLTGVNPDGSAGFRVFVNPLVSWIWSGAALMILGLLAGNLTPFQRHPAPAPSSAALSEGRRPRVRAPGPAGRTV
jgi:cytochrome c-type biogenesis protein CcmF